MLNRQLILFSIWFLLGSPASSTVLVRWTEPVLPKTPLGISELVIGWDAKDTLLENATKRGYRVYVEVSPQQLSDAATFLNRAAVEGLIVETGKAQDAGSELATVRAAHPKLKILLLNSDGKEPQMRGQTVTTRNGVLQVSSATAQPWLDSNLAMARFQQEAHPGPKPAYSFAWELNDSLQRQNGPSADDYALAIAESDAIQADLILSLHQSLQKALIEDQPAAWTMWKKLISYFRFASAESARGLPWSNVGVFTEDYNLAYEPMNLMARHNIPFRVLPAGLNAASLRGLSVVIAFTASSQQDSDALNAFAKQGGTVVMVDAKGKYPWQSVEPVHTAEHALSYKVEKGKVIELAEPVSDPETFAEDVRRLIPRDDVLISLWNALTTIAVPYRSSSTGEVVINLINYAEEPMRIQVEVKDSFSTIRYETPEHGCCLDLSPVKRDGFTDFVVPSVVIAGRIHLKPARVQDQRSKK